MTKKRKGGILRILIPVFIAFLMMFMFYKIGLSLFSNKTDADKQAALTGEIVEVNIPEGASTKDIAEILKEAGLINNVTAFRFKSKLNGSDGSYKSGTHYIEMGTDTDGIMSILTEAVSDQTQLKITIPEGYTAYQIADLLETKGIMTATEFIDAVNSGEYDYEFLKDLPERKYKLDGYLFPDTYFLKEGITAEELINKMLARFEEIYDAYKAEIAQSGKTLDEIIVVASIIEAEIQVAEEREIASGVVYNRIEADMPLQMCSTVLYALEIRRANITLDDLKVDSPYNTYIYSGLPVGPISNPGEACIKAAINPAEHDYMFFVLKGVEGGEHVFTETYDEFLTAKAEYKQQF